MAVIQLSEVEALPDALSAEHFIINFGSVPGAGDAYRLTLACNSVPMPGTSIETMEQSYSGGHTRKFPGRRLFPRSFSANFTEHVDIGALTILRKWFEELRGTESGTSSGYMDDTTVTAETQAYDHAGNLADFSKIYRCFPTEISDIEMSSDGSQIVKVAATFSYDYCEYKDVPLR